ncbi:uncharacterized protein LOC124300069 isoform X2 [Neodiprion virginianus]|uniref:uncharacterized protein LOC124300069 isoform X2 n=1 Tax=Neodiprion virginianus TaxID=2961670 RepID=UPI001EE73742|nr:uncharacterized protein LOC124300069 isoform X2 [Neodiprion virginianus]
MMSSDSRSGVRQDWTMVELRGASVTGALDNPSSRSVHYTILAVLDTVFSGCVAAPMVVGYWRGTWGLSDFYIYPEDEILSCIASIVIGFSGLFIFSVSQNFLDELFHPDKHRLSYYIGSRLYTAVFGFCCVNVWRGAWQALDATTGLMPSTVLATTGIALIALALLRVIRNIAAPPFTISVDSCPGYFDVPTMFRVENTRDWSLYILDCAFSVGVVGTLVVFVWRGVWASLDLYLFPDNAEYSAVGSVVIGYTFVVITFSLQPIMCCICDRLKGLSRLIVADLFMLLSFVATVNVWRGVWNVLDLWFLPEDPELSCWITHLGCFIFLVLLNCSNSILVRGVYIDGYEDGGQCVVFPCHYLRLFFKIEREKKAARRQNIVVASRDLATIRERTGKEENGILINTPNSGIAAENPESLV